MEKSAERKLYVPKLGGPTAKMGKSAQVVKLNKKSKNVRKIQPKGSLEKKTFKGARKGGEKGEKVRKITAFFESLGNSQKFAMQNRVEPKLNLSKLITRGGGVESGQKRGGGRTTSTRANTTTGLSKGL